MKKTILYFSIFLNYTTALSQPEIFEFQYQEMELDEAYIESLSPHQLGEPFTNMMQLLKEYYIYEETSKISGQTTKFIQKPAIYYSVKKANKYALKAMKKKVISEEQARTELERVFTVALNIRHQNTEELENVLYKIKDAERIIEYYQKNIVLTD
ncbi:hypothetical protein [Reichenbachiella sp.]|uniref:hypothetical protein n=1 Tax=Reichenbachiella sp. TaxID=2184521 RepID=UPI003B58FF45